MTVTSQTLHKGSEMRPDAALRQSLQDGVANAPLSEDGTSAACMAQVVAHHVARRIPITDTVCGRMRCRRCGGWFRVSAKKSKAPTSNHRGIHVYLPVSDWPEAALARRSCRLRFPYRTGRTFDLDRTALSATWTSGCKGNQLKRLSRISSFTFCSLMRGH